VSTPTATLPAPDRDFGIDGPLLADVALEDTWPLADTRHGGRLLLFRDKGRWTVLTLRHLTTWSEKEPKSGFARVSVTTYPDLTTLATHYSGTDAWRSLLNVGSQVDADLYALWFARVREEF
jgi:hypothetical protein